MRSEPIEFGLTDKTRPQHNARRRAKTGSFAAATTSPERRGMATSAVDEAFAALPAKSATVRRVDAANGLRPTIDAPESKPATGRHSNQALVAQLAAQVDALDRQCEQLSQLLRSIDSDAARG